MIRAVIFAAFLAGINADCVPQPVPHTETGDELCRVLLKDLADVEVKASNIARDAQSAYGCTQFPSLDFFTQLIVTIVADNTWLDDLVNGRRNPTGDECVGVNLRIDFDITNIQSHASTPVPGDNCDALTGSALAQYTLQRFGLTLNALKNPACNGGGSGSYGAMAATQASAGKWAGIVKSLNDAIAAIKTVINTNDVANCVTSTKKLATGLQGLLEAGGYTSISQG